MIGGAGGRGPAAGSTTRQGGCDRADSVRIQVLSDLHGEFGLHSLPDARDLATGADVLLLAGDTSSAVDAVWLAARLFPSAGALVLVGGNHEHYKTGMTVDDGLVVMRGAAGRLAADQGRVVAVLEDEALVARIRGTDVRILGATFWTDYGLHGRPVADAARCARLLNDHQAILGRDGRRFPTHEAADRHRDSRAFLARALALPHEGPTIVLTHHLPSMRSVPERFRGEASSAGFASNADDLVGMGAALWVHGHTHDGCVWRDGSGTLVVCNPAGYPRRTGPRENGAFHPRLVVSVGRVADGWRASR